MPRSFVLVFLLLTLMAARAAADPPRPGEIRLEGMIGKSIDFGGRFTLLADKHVAPNGTVTNLDPPRPHVVRVGATTRLGREAFAPLAMITRADLAQSARVVVVGKIVKIDLAARVVLVEETAGEALGANLLKPFGEMAWDFSVLSDKTKATFALDKGALKVRVSQAAGTDWHVQLSQQIALKDGQAYTLRFRARADVPRYLAVDSQRGEPQYKNVGLYQMIRVTTDWKPHQITFTAQNAGDKAAVQAPNFLLGARPGTLWLADVVLVEGARPSLEPLAPSPPAGVNLLVRPDDVNFWVLFQNDPGQARLTNENKALRVEVIRLDEAKTDWHVQAFLVSDLEEGRSYTLRFLAKADAARRLPVLGAIDYGDYGNIGLRETVALTTAWKTYTLSFVAKNVVAGHNKAPTFALGEQTGVVWIANVSLTPGPPVAGK